VQHDAGANADLIDRARRGEARAFEDLARTVEAPLYRHVYRILGNVVSSLGSAAGAARRASFLAQQA